MNETLHAIQNRYSCRSFTGQMPEDAKIEAIAQAAIQSPSAINLQPWQVIVVKNKTLIDELEAEGMRLLAEMPDPAMYQRIQSRGGKLFYNAPFLVVIAIDAAEPTRAILDCGIVCQSITLAAHSLGLASCICGLAGLAFGASKAAYFKEKLLFPQGYEFGMAVLLGESAEATAPHEPNQSKISTIG